jgi:hypothetical protein
LLEKKLLTYDDSGGGLVMKTKSHSSYKNESLSMNASDITCLANNAFEQQAKAFGDRANHIGPVLKGLLRKPPAPSKAHRHS